MEKEWSLFQYLFQFQRGNQQIVSALKNQDIPSIPFYAIKAKIQKLFFCLNTRGDSFSYRMITDSSPLHSTSFIIALKNGAPNRNSKSSFAVSLPKNTEKT